MRKINGDFFWHFLLYFHMPRPSCPGLAAPAQCPQFSCPCLVAPAQLPRPSCPSLAPPAQMPRPQLLFHYYNLWGNYMGKINGEIYGGNLWGKLMGEIYGGNLWGKLMGQINGTFHRCNQCKIFPLLQLRKWEQNMWRFSMVLFPIMGMGKKYNY